MQMEVLNRKSQRRPLGFNVKMRLKLTVICKSSLVHKFLTLSYGFADDGVFIAISRFTRFVSLFFHHLDLC